MRLIYLWGYRARQALSPLNMLLALAFRGDTLLYGKTGAPVHRR